MEVTVTAYDCSFLDAVSQRKSDTLRQQMSGVVSLRRSFFLARLHNQKHYCLQTLQEAKGAALTKQDLLRLSLRSTPTCGSPHCHHNHNASEQTVEALRPWAEQQMGDVFSGVTALILFSLVKSQTDLTGTDSVPGLHVLSGLVCLWNGPQSVDSDKICSLNPIRNKRSLSGALRWPQSKPVQLGRTTRARQVCVCVWSVCGEDGGTRRVRTDADGRMDGWMDEHIVTTLDPNICHACQEAGVCVT
ncbi:hypothetical protein L3Q82_007726 [Scortum barcoo]|uniref:Uncharacterized protein n=1 Tax=Scortum barcoo TaxID=214431 RepID=A0ACB8WNA2_9TELE|nr:hypothetical protein L3Q82_007726 [Scortum barcoo]